jgi:hypothetical protein
MRREAQIYAPWGGSRCGSAPAEPVVAGPSRWRVTWRPTVCRPLPLESDPQALCHKLMAGSKLQGRVTLMSIPDLVSCKPCARPALLLDRMRPAGAVLDRMSRQPWANPEGCEYTHLLRPACLISHNGNDQSDTQTLSTPPTSASLREPRNRGREELPCEGSHSARAKSTSAEPAEDQRRHIAGSM